MSSIASFYRFHEADLPGLREAAEPSRRRRGSARDPFWEYVETRGEPVVEFDGSGHIFGTLTAFLSEKHDVSWMDSSHADLSRFLCEARQAMAILLTADQRRRYLSSLESGAFDEASLRAYYSEFNEYDEPDAGSWMLSGIEAIRAALEVVVDDTVVLMYVG